MDGISAPKAYQWLDYNVNNANRESTVPDSRLIRGHDADGKSPTEIAALLGITAQSVRNVLSGFAENGVPPDDIEPMHEIIRRANSPDRKWPAPELFSLFGFSTRVRNAILPRWDETSKHALLSLRELLDIFVSEEPAGRPGFVITPFLDFRNGGVKGFWESIDQITHANMGECANEIWRSKINRLEKADRIKGHYVWSKPARQVKRLTPGLVQKSASQSHTFQLHGHGLALQSRDESSDSGASP